MGLNPDQVKPKTMKLVFVASHTTLRRKSKDWLAQNQSGGGGGHVLFHGLVSVS
jgi:hypothetical protein